MNDDMTTITGPRAALIEGWTALWNGDLTRASVICDPDVGIRFGGREIGQVGDAVTTPDQLAHLIGEFRASRRGLRYEAVEARTTAEWGWCVWDATMGDLHVGGIDTFTFTPAGIRQVWSVTGGRSMAPPLPRG